VAAEAPPGGQGDSSVRHLWAGEAAPGLSLSFSPRAPLSQSLQWREGTMTTRAAAIGGGSRYIDSGARRWCGAGQAQQWAAAGVEAVLVRRGATA
jgi:hypothetical protein